MAIYHFARTADDIADEGDADATVRLAELAAYRQALQDSLMAGAPISSRWSGIFSPLRQAVQQHGLPAPLLHDLISAFEQDVRHTAAGHHYTDTTELLDYCRLSANPVGRLLLHLYGVHDPASLAQSDQICSALQLINFWQDISVDLPRQRHYLPTEVLRRHGLPREAFDAGASPDAATQVRMAHLVTELCAQARMLMQQGAPLARRIPGRAGWELRLVVQGGLLILDKIAALQHRSWQQRPRVGAADLPRLVWRALLMR
jgi:squalene synthase HpnC